MKVYELLEILKKTNPKTEVVLQIDEEGNNYMSLNGYWVGSFNKKNKTAGILKLTEELKNNGYYKADVVQGDPAIFLWG